MTIKNLSFSYGTHQVLSDVSFEAKRGELLCVLGPNGVGKSTLFRCMLGLERSYGGEIIINGEPARNVPPGKFARLAAYVPQSHLPTFNYSVFDMVLMGTTATIGSLSSPGKAQIHAAEEAIERVGIAHLRSRGFLRISGGERQLTLIARALAQRAGVIIMDEPTANLDYGNGLRVLMQVKALAREGLGIIQSTHNPDQAFMFADSVLALRDGTAAAYGAPEQALTEELIEGLYGVRVRLRKGESGILSCEPVID